MKTKKHVSLICLFLAISIAVISPLNSRAACSYGPVMIICHASDYSSFTSCCWSGSGICSVYPFTLWYTTTTLSKGSTEGRAPTCGGGTSASSIGGAFSGVCGWSNYGVDCNGPWGPVADTGSVTLYPCIGTCGS